MDALFVVFLFCLLLQPSRGRRRSRSRKQTSRQPTLLAGEADQTFMHLPVGQGSETEPTNEQTATCGRAAAKPKNEPQMVDLGGKVMETGKTPTISRLLAEETDT